MKKEMALYVIAAASGVSVWVALCAVSGRREAWDSSMYFTLGIPALCIIAACLAFIQPVRPWRWSIIPMFSQAAWMILSQGPGNLLPIGLVFFAILSVPPLVAAWIGAAIRSWTKS